MFTPPEKKYVNTPPSAQPLSDWEGDAVREDSRSMCCALVVLWVPMCGFYSICIIAQVPLLALQVGWPQTATAQHQQTGRLGTCRHLLQHTPSLFSIFLFFILSFLLSPQSFQVLLCLSLLHTIPFFLCWSQPSRPLELLVLLHIAAMLGYYVLIVNRRLWMRSCCYGCCLVGGLVGSNPQKDAQQTCIVVRWAGVIVFLELLQMKQISFAITCQTRIAAILTEIRFSHINPFSLETKKISVSLSLLPSSFVYFEK